MENDSYYQRLIDDRQKIYDKLLGEGETYMEI